MTVYARLFLEAVGNAAAATYEFISWDTDANWSMDQEADELEELTAKGLDGARYRLTGAQWEPFDARSICVHSDYTVALTRARIYKAAKGRIGRLTIIRGSASFPVIVLGASPVVQSGIVGGETGDAYILTTWNLRRIPST